MSLAYASVCLPEALRRCGEYKRVAGILDVNWRTVYKWSTGESPIPAERVDQLAEALVSCGHGPSASQCLRNMATLIDDLAKASEDRVYTAAEAASIRDDVQHAIGDLETLARSVERRANA